MNARSKIRALLFSLMALWCCFTSNPLWAQQANPINDAGGGFKINDSIDTIEMTVGSSRRLSFDYKVPEVIVENPNLLNATPISAYQVNVSARQAGVSTITFRDTEGKSQTITIVVKMDVRKVEMAISQHFPTSNVKVTALSTGIVLAGHVSRAQDVDPIMAIAQDFYASKVINLLEVEGAQVVAIEVKVYEVSRTKLKNLGIDWAVLGQRFNIVNGFADLIQDVTDPTSVSGDANVAIGVINNNGSFNMVVNALEKNNIAKLLSQPTLITSNGRPAEFLSGGEIPILVPSGLGTTSIEFRPFGTKLDFVPLVHGEGNLTLEVRAEVSEIATELSTSTGVPGFRVRRVNTGVPMRAGQTVALAGDIFEKTDTEVRGAPGLVDVPFWGAPFRNSQDKRVETELVFLITPRFVASVDPTVTPLPGPGTATTNPSNLELFSNGYIEVPDCQQDCPRDLGAPFSYQNYNQGVPTNAAPGGMYDPNAYPQNAVPPGVGQPVPSQSGAWNSNGYPAPAAAPQQPTNGQAAGYPVVPANSRTNQWYPTSTGPAPQAAPQTQAPRQMPTQTSPVERASALDSLLKAKSRQPAEGPGFGYPKQQPNSGSRR
ncbi:MAG: pilus assembly protein N-terminal domain-containing protein [Planctomycetota bacterium]